MTSITYAGDIDYLGQGGPMAIVVVNPNPVFDRTIVVERLTPGTVMRTLEVEVTAAAQVSTGAGVSQVYVTINSFLFASPCVDKRHTLGRY